MGKTAVSLAAARAAAAGFADGSLLLRLDQLRDEALLPHTIAAALRLPGQYTRSRLDVLVDVLVARLDEHVGDRGCDDILLLLVTMR